MTNKKPKIQTLHKDPYRFEFYIEGDEVICKAYRRVAVRQPSVTAIYSTEPCLEWSFPKVPGNNIIGNASIYLEQAWMYAENPPGSKEQATSVVSVEFKDEDLMSLKNIPREEARLALERMSAGLTEYLNQMGSDYLSEHFDDED